MRHNRARARKIRALMAATGQPFILASRALDQGGSSYLRTEWGTSGWSRLLPRQAMNLELVIGTATVTGQDGDLAALVAAHPISTRYPGGLDTTLTWHDYDADDQADDEDTDLARAAQAAFTVAVTASGRTVPTTLGGLAELLTDLGIYRHTLTGAGTHRWRIPEQLPDPADVLPLPADWAAREEQIHWASHTLGPATALARILQTRHLDDARYGQSGLDTTLQRLASDADMPVEMVRDGLDGLIYRAGLTAQRRGITLGRHDLTTLADHARIHLVIDWTAFESIFGDPNESEEVVWDGPPWQIYRSIADNPQVGKHSFVIGLMEFRIRKPTGGSFITCLDVMAQQQGISVTAAASSLIELEEAGLLRWRVDEQVAELAERPDQFADA